MASQEEIDRRVSEFCSELYSHQAFDSETQASPYSPSRAMSHVVALGPEVVPALLRLLEKGDRDMKYWVLIGLRDLGPRAGSAAVDAIEPLVKDGSLGDGAAATIGVIDEAHFFAHGLHANKSAVGTLSRRYEAQGTAGAWLERVFATGHEVAAGAAIDALHSIELNDKLLNVLRSALTSPFEKVRNRAAWLLGQVPGAAGAESLIDAMVSGGRVTPEEAVAHHPRSIELVELLVQQENVGILASVLMRRRCAGLTTPPELVRGVIEHKLRHPKREWRFEQHDVHDAASCAVEIGDEKLLPALVDAVIPANGGYAWGPLTRALAFFGERAVALLEVRASVADKERAERIAWMREALQRASRPENASGDAEFVRGSIDHTTGGAFAAYAAVLRYQPSAHAAFQLAWIDRAFGAEILPERAAWIRSLGCKDETLMAELSTPVAGLAGLRLSWRKCGPSDVEKALAAGLPGLASTGSKDPALKAAAEAHVARVRAACAS